MSARAAELRVCEYLKSHGWSVLFHDVKLWRTQVDIIARAPDGLLVMVEVKSQSSGALAWLPPKQKFRLGQVAAFLSGFEPVEMRLAFVHARGITFIPVAD